MNLIELAETWALTRASSNAPIDDFLDVIIAGGSVDSRLDKSALKDRLIAETGSMTPLYTVSDVFIRMAQSWLKTRKDEIAHLLDALMTEYKPYEDFREHKDDILDRDDKTKATTKAENEGEYHTTDEHTVSADNEALYQPRDKDQTDNNHKDTTDTKFEQEYSRDDDRDIDYYGHKRSNQDNAMREVDVAMLNAYDLIAAWWTDALFVGVY